jgi:hypothetical protein
MPAKTTEIEFNASADTGDKNINPKNRTHAKEKIF